MTDGYLAIVTAIKWLATRGVDVTPYLDKMLEVIGEKSVLNDVFNHDYKQRGVNVRVDFLPNYGHRKQSATRDAREPKLLEKLKLERWLQDIFTRRLKEQLRALEESYKIAKPKKLPPARNEPSFISEIISALLTGVSDGIDLFSESVTMGFDFGAANEYAAKWVEEYAFDLIKGIDETSLEVVRRAIGGFVDEVGYTIGDVIDLIEPYFGDVRASMIAVTETTRAFANGQRIAADEVKKEFPDVQITKTWFTNNDDRVCDICGPLDGQEVPMDEPFSSGDMEPPAHVNCRCWIEYNTRLE